MYKAVVETGLRRPYSLIFTKLTQSEEEFRLAFEKAKDAIFWADAETGLILKCNKAAEMLLELESTEIVGQHQTMLHPPGMAEHYAEVFRSHVEQRAFLDEEAEVKTRSGAIKLVQITATITTLAGRRIIQGTFRDISEQKRQQARTKQAAMVTTAAKTALDTIAAMTEGVLLSNGDGNVVSVNPSFQRLTGYELGQLLGKNAAGFLRNLVRPEDQVSFAEFLAALKQGRDCPDVSATLLGKSARRIPITLTLSFLRRLGRQYSTAVITIRDITDLKQAEADLRNLASALSLTEEKERKRLAEALHDSVGQKLALSNLKLGNLEKLLASREEREEKELLNEIRGIFEEGIREIRSLTFELSPPILYELGLGAAVEWLGEQFRRQHGIAFHCERNGEPRDIDEAVSVLLFQSVRELLTNVFKHARASRVDASISSDDAGVTIVVKDDGVGFNVVSVRNRPYREHTFGVFSIRERMRQMGGKMQIESKPGTGTTVTLSVPLRLRPRNGREDQNVDASLGG